MADLSCEIAGIRSRNPFWLASGPPTNRASQVIRGFEAGFGGAVWKTLCPNPVRNVSPRIAAVSGGAPGLPFGITNVELIMDRPISEHLADIALVKKEFPDRPVIASIMAGSRAQWKSLVDRAEDSGVDGFELNFSCPHGMCERGQGSAVGQEPTVLRQITEWVREMTGLPMLVKLTPNVTDIVAPAAAAVRAGADGLSLVNTVLSIPGVDLETLSPLPDVSGRGTPGGMCGPAIKPIALRMVAELALHPGIGVPISGIGGVSSWQDAAEFILLGAWNVQACFAVMTRGFGVAGPMIEGLNSYMDRKGFATVADMRGAALNNLVSFGEMDLDRRIEAVVDPVLCTRCGNCVTACSDGGHQAVKGGQERPTAFPPSVDPALCTGCGLCFAVCPVPGAITFKTRF